MSGVQTEAAGGGASRRVRVPKLRRWSLRMRLHVVLAALMLPLVILGVTGVSLLRDVTGAEGTSGRAAERVAAIAHLRVSLRSAIAARTPAERRRLDRAVEAAYADLIGQGPAADRSLARESRGDWRRARAAREPNAWLGRADAELESLSALASRTLTAHEARASAAHADLQLMFLLACGLAMFLAAVAASRLSRSVINPVRSLEDAAKRLTTDDFAARLPVNGDDEIARLTETFNAMADTLSRTRSALGRQAHHDPLTNLPNLRLLHETLAAAGAAAQRDVTPLAVAVIDLDDFKDVNDSRGHLAADDVLREAAHRLRDAARATDLVARLGGDEFAAVFPGLGGEEALAAVQRMAAAMAASPTSGFPLTCSAGVATFPDDVADTSRLLELADAARYWAKRNGKACVRRYDAAHLPSVGERGAIEKLLERPDSLTTVVQPIIALGSGRVVAYEALTRFHACEGRPPEVWFQEAQRCGLGRRLEAHAIRRALAHAGRPSDVELSVNLSPSALLSLEVQTAFPADLSSIVIELTEHELSTLGDDLDAALELMRARGARIAIDDAGSGYAGLQQVMRVRPDIVKLDATLVRGVHQDAAKVALIESFVRFARRTGSLLCAEGVEELEDLRLLADIDVDWAQGYAIGTPSAEWSDASPEAATACRERLARTLRRDGLSNGGTDGDGALARLSAALAGAKELSAVAATAAAAATTLDADASELHLLDPDGHTLRLAGTPVDADAPPPPMRPAFRRALDTHDAALVTDADARQDDLAALRRAHDRSALVLPIVCERTALGILVLTRTTERHWRRRDVDRAWMIANQIGQAVARTSRKRPRRGLRVVRSASGGGNRAS